MESALSPGQVIAKHLKRSGMTKAAFARALKVSRAAVDQWLDGDTVPTLSNLIEITRVLDFSLAEFGDPGHERPMVGVDLRGVDQEATEFLLRRWAREADQMRNLGKVSKT
jgi:transcriptional regulator with XRE-family HTH domain